MELDSTILADFKKITGKDISKYFRDAVNFFAGDYNAIVDYYTGNSTAISSIPFSNLDILIQENKDILEAFKEHARQFNNLKWWLLLEQVEEIDNRLATVKKINKWARSSVTNVAYNPNIQIDYKLKQNQTLESVAAGIVGSNNPNDDWADIAIQNNLTEDSYSPEGGKQIKLVSNLVNTGIKVNAVADVIQGRSINGKDVYKKIQWVVDQDGFRNLKVLGFDETILQAVNILANLKKNDNPDNPNNGLQSNLVAGSNRALFNFPVIIRQMSQTFANDDTLKDFKINSIQRDQDNIFIDFVVYNRVGEVISQTVVA